MSNSLFATKPVQPAPHVDAGELHGELKGEATLKRTLTATQLTALGIGATIGAGIFVISGQAAAEHAGPAIILSFIIASVACAFAGLCYAEFASMLPVSGSAYSYAYATLGEIVAWFIGWNLVLEYLFAASTVAVGWSGYFNSLLQTFGLGLPASLAAAPLNVVNGSIVYTGGYINLPAVAIVAAISAVCYVGIRQSAILNSAIVAIKLVVILMFVAFGMRYVDPANWHPFIPENQGPGKFGFEGVVRGAALVFFAYVGFDAVSTAAGEAKNPQRDMPIGLLGSLILTTIIYVIVAAVLTGLLPFGQLATPKPVATALEAHSELSWLKMFIEVGAIAGLSSVILVQLVGQSRVFYAMSQDRLLPPLFSRVHPKFQTPYKSTVVVGIAAAILAGLLPIGLLGELVSMGTLLAFTTVCAGVLVLRRTRPDLPRPFRVWMPELICPLGIIACLYLFWQSFIEHYKIILSWTAVGFLIYSFYSYRNSGLRNKR